MLPEKSTVSWGTTPKLWRNSLAERWRMSVPSSLIWPSEGS